MNAERAIRWSTVAAVTGVAVIAGIVSYEHAYTVVHAHGEPGPVARIYPGTIDGLVFAASMVLLDSARRRVQAPPMARWMLAAGIAATLAANILAGVHYGLLGAVVAAWPAPALVGSYELLLWIVRTGSAAAPAAGAVPGDRALARPQAAPESRAPAAAAAGRARKRAPVRAPVTPESAEAQFAAVLAEGRVPSLRQVKDELSVGTDKARSLRDHLAVMAANQTAVALSALADDPQISGAELGRQLGVSPRTGQRIRDRLATPAPTTTTSPERQTA